MTANIFVYEHVSAGGMPGPVPAALADAGQAMWLALVDDFAGAGAKVWTTRGDREDITLDGQAMAHVKPAGEIKALVQQIALKCEGAIIIAPETDGILEQWVEQFLAWSIPVLNCGPKTIALCADKLLLCRHLEKHGIATVPTKGGDVSVLLDGVGASLTAAGGAYVIKPRDGAGCESTFVCRTLFDVEAARKRAAGANWIAQPFVEGISVSMSFIANGAACRPLLAGSQCIEGSSELHYEGGMIPLEKKLAERAAWLATQAVKTLKDLRGFIGVDLILGENARDDMVVEINPRVTVSYCGLRKLCATNLPLAMMDDNAEIKWRRGSVRFNNAGQVSEGGK